MSHFSLSKKFIFIHVPKTGGVAMLDYLKRTKDLQKVQDLRDELGFTRSGWMTTITTLTLLLIR